MTGERVNFWASATWKECPVCGEVFYIPRQIDWAYKRGSPDMHGRMIFFSRWSCMRAWDSDAEREKEAAEKHERRVSGTKKGWQTRRAAET